MPSENSKTNTCYRQLKAIGAGRALAAVGFLRLLAFRWLLIGRGRRCFLGAW